MTIMAMLVAASCADAATLTAEPERVVFDNMGGSATVRVLADGVAVPAAEIQGFHLMVGGSDYSHMFRFSKADGTVTLTPGPAVEVGSYDLRITTAKGDAWLKVYTPLGEKQTSLQKLAQKLNMPVDELKRQTGLSKETARRGVEMSLPPVFPVGRMLTVDMGAAADVKARWEVDRKVISDGPGAGALAYLFSESGPHLFTYTEFRGDAVVAQVSAVVEGAENPANDISVAAGAALTLEAPAGYGQHTWTVNGEPADGDATLEVRRDSPCEVLVKVLSEKPKTGHPGEFDRTTYRVKVTPKQK
jgi:hypothetical protein